MSGETEVIARHEQGDRALSGGTDAGQLAETMERHAPPEQKVTDESASPVADVGAGTVPAAQQDAKPTRGQARFSELAKARDAAQARADAAEARAKELEAKIAAPPAREPEQPKPAEAPVAAAPVVDPKDPEPSEADFDDYKDFTKALARWEFRQAKREEAAEANAAKQREAATAAERTSRETFNAWTGRRDAFVAAHPDRAASVNAYLETLSSGTPIGDAILESDVGPELADFLAGNQAEAQRIAGLSPVSAIRALGRIEQQLAAPAATPRAEWKAPAAPMTPVNGNSPTTPVRSSELASKGHDFDASGYRERRAAERKRAGRQ